MKECWCFDLRFHALLSVGKALRLESRSEVSECPGKGVVEARTRMLLQALVVRSGYTSERSGGRQDILAVLHLHGWVQVLTTSPVSTTKTTVMFINAGPALSLMIAVAAALGAHDMMRQIVHCPLLLDCW